MGRGGRPSSPTPFPANAEVFQVFSRARASERRGTRLFTGYRQQERQEGQGPRAAANVASDVRKALSGQCAYDKMCYLRQGKTETCTRATSRGRRRRPSRPSRSSWPTTTPHGSTAAT